MVIRQVRRKKLLVPPDTSDSGIHVDYELVLQSQKVLEQREQDCLSQPIQTVSFHWVWESDKIRMRLRNHLPTF